MLYFADKTEVGWYPIQERCSKVNSNITYQCDILQNMFTIKGKQQKLMFNLKIEGASYQQ
jgi:hypothetical protein